MDMAGALLLLKPTCLFFWILFLLSLYWVVFPYLFTVTVTSRVENSCPPAQNHCTQVTMT